MGPFLSNRLIASIASVSGLFELAIFCCRSRSIKCIDIDDRWNSGACCGVGEGICVNSLSGSKTMSSLSVSLSGMKSGHWDRASDKIILSPGM